MLFAYIGTCVARHALVRRDVVDEEVSTEPYRALRRRVPRCDDPTTIFDAPVVVAEGSQGVRMFARPPTAEELDQSYEAAMALF